MLCFPVLLCAVLCCSGFEGSWVTHPTRWTNQFFRNLLKYDWEVHEGPGGHNQWRPKHKTTAPAAVKAKPLPEIMSELTYPIIRKYTAAMTWAMPVAFAAPGNGW
jgi:hypothetical protein